MLFRSAVGVSFPIIFMFVSLFMGLSSGGTVTIAQFYGANQLQRVQDTVDTIYTAFLAAVLPLSVGAMLLVDPILKLLQMDPSAMSDAKLYLLIICGGLIGSIGYNTNAGILNGLGNSGTTLLFLTIAAVMNIVLDLVLVLQIGRALV